MLTGNPVTFEANPASSDTETNGARYKLSVVDDSKINFALSFWAACFITSA